MFVMLVVDVSFCRQIILYLPTYRIQTFSNYNSHPAAAALVTAALCSLRRGSTQLYL